MKERFLNWLEDKAGNYLRWCYERRYAVAEATDPTCPDCQMPESFCYCEERDRQRDEMESIFASGVEHGYERAGRGER